MTPRDITNSFCMNSILNVSGESDHISNYSMSESSINFQKIVEGNSNEYVSTYVRLLTTTILLLTNYTTQHTPTQTKMDVN